jgi:hypothetical protein
MNIRDWQLTERARREQYLDMLQSGYATTQGRRGLNSPLVDTTVATIGMERAAIAELSEMIAQFEII